MCRAGIILAFLSSLSVMQALADAGGGEGGGGPMAGSAPSVPVGSSPRNPASGTVNHPAAALPGIYGKHLTRAGRDISVGANFYELGKTGVRIAVFASRKDGSPELINFATTDPDDASYVGATGKLVSFEPRHGGSYVIEIEQAHGERVRIFIGRTGKAQILPRGR